MDREPVVYAEVIRAVIVAVVSLGWITLDSNTINVVATGLGLVLSWVLSLITRGRVTPTVGASTPGRD